MKQSRFFKVVLIHLLLSWLTMPILWAQTSIVVKGKIIDQNDQSPLPGVNVTIKGTTVGVVSNLDGEYSIKANERSILVFSFIGMTTQEVLVGNKTQIDIALEGEHNSIDEVVAIGYGTARKRDLTGSIVSVKGDDIKNAPSVSPLSALQGKVAGLTIVNAGNAGGTPQITVRGVGSLGNAQPYYIVDGMFTDNIDFVNPTDIESMEVLKDASSLAMFGVKGANGIIIITTKKGKQGSPRFSFDAYTGFQQIMKMDKPGLTNGEQFTMLYNELRSNTVSDILDGNPDAIIDPSLGVFLPQVQGKGTDWLDEVTQMGKISNITFTASSATDKSNSLMSIGYFSQDGVVKYDNYQRFTGRFNHEYQMKKGFKIGANVGLSYWSKDANSFAGYGKILNEAMWAMPTYTPYLDGTKEYMMPDRNVQGNVVNPVALAEIGKFDNKSQGYRGFGNLFAEIDLFKGLKFRTNFSGDVGINSNKTFKEKFFLDSAHKNDVSSMSRDTRTYTTAQTENFLQYENRFGKHRVSALAGVTTYYKKDEGFNASRDSIAIGLNHIDEFFHLLSMGSNGSMKNGDSIGDESQVSVLGRVNYAYEDKYLVSATFRRDGSSKFAPQNRWGNFPSLGLGWVLSEEAFMANASMIDFMKLKASWGQLGNDRSLGRYDYYTFINLNGANVIFGNQIISIPTITGMADPNLRWERMEGYELGIETKMLSSRLSAELNYFYRKTWDFISTVPVPASIGGGFRMTNAGSMRNTGLELMVGWKDNIGELGYSVSGNFSFIDNKMLAIGADDADVFSGNCITRVGETIASFYGLQTDGIFQNTSEINAYTNQSGTPIQPTARPGDFKFKDLSGDGKIDGNDRTILGSHFAPFQFGVNLKLDYKGFDFGLDINGVAGNEIYNEKIKPTGFNQYNFHETWLNRWRGEGTSNTHPILSPGQRPDNLLPSDFFVESGSYLRVRNIQFGYTLDKKWLNKTFLSSMRVYANIDNLLTIKSFEGWTPEVGGGPLNSGVDGGSLYPIPATFTVGINVNF